MRLLLLCRQRQKRLAALPRRRNGLGHLESDAEGRSHILEAAGAPTVAVETRTLADVLGESGTPRFIHYL